MKRDKILAFTAEASLYFFVIVCFHLYYKVPEDLFL